MRARVLLKSEPSHWLHHGGVGNASEVRRDTVTVPAGMSPADVAAHVVGAVAAGRFYVLTHPGLNEAIRRRTDEVLAGGPPAGLLS